MDANSTLWTPTAHYGRQQHNMDANSTIGTPTTHEFSPKSRQSGEKFVQKNVKRVKIPYLSKI
jgi:hypothetical protein